MLCFIWKYLDTCVTRVPALSTLLSQILVQGEGGLLQQVGFAQMMKHNSLDTGDVLPPVLPGSWLFQARPWPLHSEKPKMEVVTVTPFNLEWRADMAVFTIVTVWEKMIKKTNLPFVSLFVAWQMLAREGQRMPTYQYKVVNVRSYFVHIFLVNTLLWCMDACFKIRCIETQKFCPSAAFCVSWDINVFKSFMMGVLCGCTTWSVSAWRK